MAFRCKVQDKIRVAVLNSLVNGVGIGEVNLQQPMPFATFIGLCPQGVFNTCQVTGVPHFVQIEDLDIGFRQESAHDGTTDKASSSCDENPPPGSKQFANVGFHGVSGQAVVLVLLLRPYTSSNRTMSSSPR